ncbi:MAG: thioesterase family protein [Bacteroidota bacterium]
MARVKLIFPDDIPLYTARILVRIGDINYGGHVGNDAILSIIHEARMRMLGGKGYDELNVGGSAMIMADVMIAYKGEAFYGDELEVKIYADEVTDKTFDLLYRITTMRDGKVAEIAHAKTGMVCFDYEARKVVQMGKELREMLAPPGLPGGEEM